MPPLPGSHSGSDSDSSSDSESVHTIDNNPRPTAAGSQPSASDTSQSQPGQRQGNHVVGAPVNKAKRKAESPSDSDGHVAKARMTESSAPESEESESDDDDIPAHTSYVEQSFSLDQLSAPEGESLAAFALHPSFPRSESHPSIHDPSLGTLTSATAAIDLYNRMFPYNKPAPEATGSRLFKMLASRLTRQVPVVATDRFKPGARPENLQSFLMQASGEQLPDHESCYRCANQLGLYRGCVVAQDAAVLAITRGACANCWYSRGGSRCTFRNPTPTEWQAAAAKTKPPVKETPVPVPQIPPAPAAASLPQPAILPTLKSRPPIHPGYAAALAAGAARTAAAPVATTTPSSTSAGLSSRAAADRSLSMDEKVGAWEKRYSAMEPDQLLVAHEHLAEWQADLMTRLAAMNRVLQKTLRERVEG